MRLIIEGDSKNIRQIKKELELRVKKKNMKMSIESEKPKTKGRKPKNT